MYICVCVLHIRIWDFPVGSAVKECACNAANAGDNVGSIPGWGRSPGGGHGNPLQYSCLENPMYGRAWWATVHGVTKNQTRLKRLNIHTYICLYT